MSEMIEKREVEADPCEGCSKICGLDKCPLEDDSTGNESRCHGNVWGG